MSNVICPSCGRIISGIASECPFCGQTLSERADAQSSGYYHEDQLYHASGVPAKQKTQIFPDQADDADQKAITKSAPQKNNNAKKNRQPRSGYAGRRLIGYRSGRFLNRLISMLYHLAITVLLVEVFLKTPEYKEKGLALMHIARSSLAALILFLPAILLSNTAFRQKLPLLRSRVTAKVVIGYLLFLVPLVLLFSYACILCK